MERPTPLGREGSSAPGWWADGPGPARGKGPMRAGTSGPSAPRVRYESKSSEEVMEAGRPTRASAINGSAVIASQGGGIDGDRAHREVREARSRTRAAGDRAV